MLVVVVVVMVIVVLVVIVTAFVIARGIGCSSDSTILPQLNLLSLLL